MLIPRDPGEDVKKERDRLIFAATEIRRFLATNLRVRAGTLKDPAAVTRAQRHYQAGASAINRMATSSPPLTSIY